MSHPVRKQIRASTIQVAIKMVIALIHDLRLSTELVGLMLSWVLVLFGYSWCTRTSSHLCQYSPAPIVRMLPTGQIQLLPVEGRISDDPNAPKAAICQGIKEVLWKSEAQSHSLSRKCFNPFLVEGNELGCLGPGLHECFTNSRDLGKVGLGR